jgi:diaminopimelate epimerase
MQFTKAHAYGNDFLYVLKRDAPHTALDVLAREMCERHTGAGADGLIVYEPIEGGASMRLLNADGSPSEVSGNGVRGLAAILLRGDHADDRRDVTIRTDAGDKRLTRIGRDGSRQTFRAAMGLPRGLKQVDASAGGESLRLTVLNIGNPQCVVLGRLPDLERFRRLGPALERHPMFPDGTNVEFVHVEAPDRVRIMIWERGVGPTTSSGTGSCASLIAAAAFGGAARDATVIAPGGEQRVEWRDDSVYLTGWAEVLYDATWVRDRIRVLPRQTPIEFSPGN